MKLHRTLACLLVPAALDMARPAFPQTQAPSEMETKEAAPKFTSRVNLVPLTVVVRDRNGHAVGNLTKEDFRLLDNGKPQVVSRFSVEKPGAPVVIEKEPDTLQPSAEATSPQTATTAAAEPVLADHFVAYLFDDLWGKAADLMRARDAAARVIATSMQPADRAAIYTTSGQIIQEFTNDKDKLQATLARLRPNPVSGGIGGGFDCPDISYYMADRIVNLNDAQALQVALINYQSCSGNQYATSGEVMGYAQSALHNGEHQTRLAALMLVQVVRRLAAMPGQRNIVLASPGFMVPFADQPDVTNVINRAIRANVVISSLDLRGLWTSPMYDASRPTPPGGPMVLTMVSQYMEQEQMTNDFVLQDLAAATGGDWFHNNNDLADGFRRLAAAPEFIYVLAFTPENLKSDGKFHKLQVTLREPKGLTLQTRKGYYAPRPGADAVDQDKQDVEDAVFSREVIKDIPLEIRTQFFTSDSGKATLSVNALIDIRGLHYKKIEGRNGDIVTVVAALFDTNGNYVAGTQKVITFRLKDETLEKRLTSGINVKNSFDVATGDYVVRVVVRDSESQMMATGNTAVEIR